MVDVRIEDGTLVALAVPSSVTSYVVAGRRSSGCRHV